MKFLKRTITILLVIAILASVFMISTVSFGASGTGTGLAEWALNAYNSHWSYVYGGSTPGAVDCSGLIYSYTGCERCGDEQLYASSQTGSVSNGIPNIHGLGLGQVGHVGVYVGDSMAVDARGDEYGVIYESAYAHNWQTWFKVNGVSYPSNGWELYCGNYYYYENGEYITDTSRTIDGETYYFSSSGICSSTPSDTSSSDSSSNSSDSSESSVLKKGSKGSKVEALQERLQELGYYFGSIDGDFGSSTEKAFRAFQKANGLTVDGIAGSDLDILYSDDALSFEAYKALGNEKTEAKEEKENGFITFSIGDKDDAVTRLETRLIQLGYLTGDADNTFDSNTEEAIKAFQEANGLEVTGIADEDTQKLLFSGKVSLQKAEKETEEPTYAPIVKHIDYDKEGITSTEVSTSIETHNSQLSSKALASITDKIGFDTDKNGNNFEFVFYLLLMIGVLIIALIVVSIFEKRNRNKEIAKDAIRKFK